MYSAPRGEIPREQGATASDMAARPTLHGGRIPDTTDAPFYNVSDVEAAWGYLLRCAVDGDGFAYDLVAVGRQVLSDRFNDLRRAFARAVALGSATPVQLGGDPIADSLAWSEDGLSPVNRAYSYYVPSSYQPGSPSPVVFVFHGWET